MNCPTKDQIRECFKEDNKARKECKEILEYVKFQNKKLQKMFQEFPFMFT